MNKYEILTPNSENATQIFRGSFPEWKEKEFSLNDTETFIHLYAYVFLDIQLLISRFTSKTDCDTSKASRFYLVIHTVYPQMIKRVDPETFR